MGMKEMVCENCGATTEVSDDRLPLECSDCGSTEFATTDSDLAIP